MKIAYIVPSLANKGPIIVVRELVKQFAAHGHECTVYYFDERTELTFDCPVQRIRSKQRPPFESFDIVHSHGFRPDRYVRRFREYGGQTLYVTTVHSYVLADLRYQYNRIISLVFGNLWMYLLKRHDKIITLSRDAVRYYRKWFPDEKLTYAYHTRTLNECSARLSESETREIDCFKQNSPLIGMNTFLTECKGVDLIIKNLKELPDYRLWVTGDGPERKKLEALAVREGVSSRCYFAGYRPDAYRYFDRYDIYAMASRSEGFGLVLLEAALYGCPTVCSDIPVLKEIFQEGEVAFFDLKNAKSLREAILKASDDKTMGGKMRRRYEQSYAPEHFYHRYLEIYNDLMPNDKKDSK